jgi:predicted aldo/keto reductase-like oxidoreductase
MDSVQMKYRRFGNLDWKVSALGFGAMRLPTIKEDQSKIDEAEAIRMIRYAIDHGVNYIDTAYPYHMGTSEILVGRALQDGYREKVKLATKMPVWQINNQQDMDRYLDEQLKKLNTYIDFYLLHGLGKDRWAKIKPLDVTGWAEKKISEGKFKYLGFSFHDSYSVFKDIIDSYKGWTLCQIQYNYMDQNCQAGTRGLKYAASKGLAVVVMEPVAGGRLAMQLAKPIAELFEKAETKRTQAEWALLWVLNHPEVSLALSGMSTMQQVQENVKTADILGPNMLSRKELQFINEVAQKYRQFGFIDCSGCGYCQPCPEGVNIPAIFALLNEYYSENMSDEVKVKYSKTITQECQAKRCKKCGRCEELCPQHLPTRKLLGNAAFMFEQEPLKQKT